MTDRKALLVGAAEYGEGFAPLPAVRNDVQAFARALAGAGYGVQICAEAQASNAGSLYEALRDFCSSGGPDDIRLLYFSGHGLRLDNTDWIVPAHTSRQQATDSATHRVSTDFSATVAASSVGLVVFVIDACRSAVDAPVTKGLIGSTADLKRRDARFVRFFGCASNQVCQVTGSADAGTASSLFTAALTASLDNPTCVTLEAVLQAVEQGCKQQIDADPTLRVQTPILSYGETSSETRDVLRRPIFERTATALLTSVWPGFDPNKLHCLVLLSEYQVTYEANNGSTWGPVDLLDAALVGEPVERIWRAFHAACAGQRLTNGRRRVLPTSATADTLEKAAFSVLDAFASPQALELAIRAVVEADLVVFDVTNFEPAMMLLVGVRSACRRALTVCSHGGEWREGMPLVLPFNLQDLNINSHKPRDAGGIGEDPVVERFVRRVETGFLQLAKHPGYLDLPGYEELRQLGSASEAQKTIAVQDRVLVLCSYSTTHFANWVYLRARLVEQLSQRKQYKPKIERVIDYGTSQLVRQGLYEQIRRVAACVADWSEFRASVFLELGTRLAVSPYGAVQVIDARWAPGGAWAKDLQQIALMQRLLEPIPYTFRGKTTTAFDSAGIALLDREPGQDVDPAYNRIHRALLRAISGVQAAITPVADALKRQADALHQSDWERDGKSPGLFTGSQAVKLENKGAALELRLAAWLYLEHRVGPAGRQADPSLDKLYHDLGSELRNLLADQDDAQSRALGRLIKKQLAAAG